MNTKKSFPCAPIVTEEDIEWLEFGFEEWVDALEHIDKGDSMRFDDVMIKAMKKIFKTKKCRKGKEKLKEMFVNKRKSTVKELV